jgi:NADPH:quinone reductase
MSRIIRFHRTGGPEVLQFDEQDIGEPKAGEVRIRVRALGLNRAESMFRSGSYLETPKLPAKLGYEASGEVEALGPGVTGFAPGDAVSTIPSFSMNHYGVYGDAAIVPARALAKHPASLSWSEAAAIWMQYITAYGALIEIAKLARGDSVVITAASSSVGLAAIEVANCVGAVPFAATRTSAKRDVLLKLGARHVIATQEQDLADEVMRLTDGKGARIAFDPVGGKGVEALAASMAEGGTIFLYGALAPDPTPYPLFAAIGKNLVIRGYTLFSIVSQPDSLERAKRFVIEGLASGSLKPIIARTFALRDIVAAHRYLESNQQIGKIVVTV